MAEFPSTRESALLGALRGDEALRRRSWERLARAYRPAIRTYVRRRWHKSDVHADELVQGFFARCLEGEVLADNGKPVQFGQALFRLR